MRHCSFKRKLLLWDAREAASSRRSGLGSVARRGLLSGPSSQDVHDVCSMTKTISLPYGCRRSRMYSHGWYRTIGHSRYARCYGLGLRPANAYGQGKSGTRIQSNTRYFRLQHVTRTVAIISTIMAAAQLIGAIAGLYFVKDKGARLGIIAVFTIVFGLSLRLLTNAKRAEIYASSAAYAAVLVVFVSGDLGQPG